jgi:hypothetical protein
MVMKWVKDFPKQTDRSLNRRIDFIHVIAQVKPSTRTRIDFGFALGPDTPFGKRLKDAGGLKKKDRITHTVAVTASSDIDDELTDWLRAAYDRDAT